MVKVIRVADDGTELAAIEVDDFTIEVLYAGLATMLREAAETASPDPVPSCALTPDARRRRQRVLSRLQD